MLKITQLGQEGHLESALSAFQKWTDSGASPTVVALWPNSSLLQKCFVTTDDFVDDFPYNICWCTVGLRTWDAKMHLELRSTTACLTPVSSAKPCPKRSSSLKR